MKKEVDLSKWDLIKYNFFVLPRSISHLRTLLFIWLIIVFVNWSSNSSNPVDSFGIDDVLGAFPVAIIAFLLWYVAVLSYAISGVHESGMTGNTTYTIEDDGFRYVTESTNSITRWENIGKVGIVGGMIYVELSSIEFRLLPRHQFSTDSEFQAFHDEIASRAG